MKVYVVTVTKVIADIGEPTAAVMVVEAYVEYEDALSRLLQLEAEGYYPRQVNLDEVTVR